jgi:hypothetical protein
MLVRKVVYLQMDLRTAKYVFMPCHHNAGSNDSVMFGDRMFENAAKFRVLVTTVTNQDYI